MRTEIEPFSEQYLLLPDVDAIEWPNQRVVVPEDLFMQMRRRVRDPVLKLSNGHYRPTVEHGIPAETVAVPRTFGIEADESVLLAKDDSVGEMIVEGVTEDGRAPPE